MKTVAEAATAYVEVLLAQREAGRQWRDEIRQCDREPKCLFEPDTFRGEKCEACTEAALKRERAQDLGRKKSDRLRTLIRAC